MIQNSLHHYITFITDSVAASWPVPQVAKPPQTVSFSPLCFTVLHPKSGHIFLLIHLSWVWYLPSRANCIFCSVVLFVQQAFSWYTPHAGHRKLDSDSNSCKGCLQVLCFLEAFLYQRVCIRAEDISSWQIIYLCHLSIEWLIFFLTPYRALKILAYM